MKTIIRLGLITAISLLVFAAPLGTVSAEPGSSSDGIVERLRSAWSGLLDSAMGEVRQEDGSVVTASLGEADEPDAPNTADLEASKDDSLFVDNNGNGVANPGDTLRYTIGITNTGDMDATGLVFDDTIDSNTTLVPGSLMITPLAFDDGPAPGSAPGDPYHTALNTTLDTTGGGESVLDNDYLGIPAADVTAYGTSGSPGTTAVGGGATATDMGGTIEVEADGEFIYTPPSPAFGGEDTFGYTMGNGFGSDTATVTIKVGAPPIAMDDARNVTGNVQIDTSITGFSILTNDTLNGATISGFDASSVNGGTVVVNASNGEFTYIPPAGFTGSDSFDYSLMNAVGSSTATVTLTVSDMIWFIDNSAGAGDGRLTSPFNLLATFDGVNDGIGLHPSSSDTIFLDETGSGDYTGGVTLLSNQIFIGKGASASIAAISGITLAVDSIPLPATSGADPVVTNAAGDGFVLATGNTIRGLNIGSTTGGFGVDGTAVGSFTLSEVTPFGAGGAIRISTSGVLAVVFDSISSTSSPGDGINLVGSSGSFQVVGVTDVNSAPGDGIEIDSSGTLDLDFAAIDVDGGGDEGIDIDGGVGDFDATSTSIDGVLGDGITVSNSAGDTFDFGVTNIGQTTAVGGDGIDVATGNAGATFTFNLAIKNSNGTGLKANNSGTININSTTATIESTGGPAVSLTSTTGQTSGSGATGWTFASLKSTDSTTDGVFLSGLTNDFTVTGDTTIARPTTDGIDINSSGSTVDYRFGDAGGTGTLRITDPGDNQANAAVHDSGGNGVDLNGVTGSFTIKSDGGGIFYNEINDNAGIEAVTGVAGLDFTVGGTGAGTSRFEIDGVSGGTSAGDAHGIETTGVDSVKVDRVLIENIAIPNSNDSAIQLTNTKDMVVVSNSDFERIDEGFCVGVLNLTATDDLSVTIKNNTFKGEGDLTTITTGGTPTECVVLTYGQFSSTTGKRVDAFISKNEFDHVARAIGMVLEGDTGTGGSGRSKIRIDQNNIEDLDNDGIDYSQGSTSVARWDITNNFIDAETGIAGGAPNRGIDLVMNVFDGVADVFVEDNEILDFQDEGIRLFSFIDPDTGLIRAFVDDNIIDHSANDQGIDIDIESGHEMQAIVTDNDIDVGNDSLQALVDDVCCGNGILCLSATGNSNLGGAGAPSGSFDLDDFVNTGDFKSPQASAAAMSTANGGVTVNASNINFGSGACTAPTLLLAQMEAGTIPSSGPGSRASETTTLDGVVRKRSRRLEMGLPDDDPNIFRNEIGGEFGAMSPTQIDAMERAEREENTAAGEASLRGTVDSILSGMIPAMDFSDSDAGADPSRRDAFLEIESAQADDDTKITEARSTFERLASTTTFDQPTSTASRIGLLDGLTSRLAGTVRKLFDTPTAHAEPAAAPSASGENINEAIGTLPQGKTVTIKFDVTIDSPFPVGISEVCNQGTLDFEDGGVPLDELSESAAALFPAQILTDDPDVAGDGDPTCTPVFAPESDLVLTKSIDPGPFIAGTEAGYLLTSTNDGPDPADGVTIEDTVPTNTRFVSAVASPAGDATCVTPAVGATGLVSCTWANTVPVGGVRTVDLTVRVCPDLGCGSNILNNLARTFSDSFDPDFGNSAQFGITGGTVAGVASGVVAQSTLDITKTDSPDPVLLGSNVTYTIVVANTGPSNAQGTIVRDTLPPNFTFVSASSANLGAGVCAETAPGSGIVECNLGVLGAPDQCAAVPVPMSDTITIVATAGLNAGFATSSCNAGLVDNRAEISSTNCRPDLGTLNDSESTCVIAPDLTISKVTDPLGGTSVIAGTDQSYTVSVTNDGLASANDVVITDTLPSGVTLKAVGVAVGCVVTLPPGQVQCALTTPLAPGETEDISIQVTVCPEGLCGSSIVNAAEVTTSSPEIDTTNNSTSLTLDVEAQSEFTISKSGPTGSVTAGNAVTYLINVSNLGPSNAAGTVVRDTLPPNFTFVSASSANLGAGVCAETAPGSGIVDCNLGVLGAPNQCAAVPVPTSDTITVIATAGLNPGLATASCNAGLVDNRAEISSTNCLPDLGTLGSTVQTCVVAPDLTITKDTVPPGQTTVIAGTDLQYQIAVTNEGLAPAGVVWVTDTLPANATILNATPSAGGGCSIFTPGVLSCSWPPSLGPSESHTVDVFVGVCPGETCADTVMNTAETSGQGVELDTTNNSTSLTLDVEAQSEFTISKTGPTDTVTPGDIVTYVIDVSNLGPSNAAGTVVVDTLPTGWAFVSGSSANLGAVCTETAPGSRIIECDLGVLGAPNQCATASAPESDTITIMATAGPAIGGRVEASCPGMVVDNLAEISSANCLPDLGTLSDTHPVCILGADLKISKDTVPPGQTTVLAGDTLVYEVTSTNVGFSMAADALITDTLPAGVTFISAVPTPGTGSCSHSAGVVSCVWNSPLDVGDSVGAVITVVVCADGACASVLDNNAETNTSSFDVDLSNNVLDPPLSVSVLTQSAFTLTKSAPASVIAGQQLVYTIDVGNTGPSNADSVELVDTLPAGVTFVSASTANGGSCTEVAGVVTCDLGTIGAPNQCNTNFLTTDRVTITVDTCSGSGCGSTLTNSVTIASDNCLPDQGTTSTTTNTTVESSADLSITKTGDPDPVIAGSTLIYTLNVNNAGPSDASDVIVTDTLDPLVSFVSATVTPAGPTCAEAGGIVTCTMGAVGAPAAEQCGPTIPSGYTIEIEVLVSDLAPCSPNQCPGSEAFGAGPLTNVADVAATDRCTTDPVPGNNTDTEETDVLAGADVLIAPPGLEKFADSPSFALDRLPVLDEVEAAETVDSSVSSFGPADSVGADAQVTTSVELIDADSSDATDYALMQDPDECLSVGDEILVTQVFSNTGPMAFTTQRDNRGPEFESVHPTQVDGLLGTCEILEGGGTCSLDEARAQWNGEIPVGGRVTLQYRVRIKGGLPFGEIITFIGKVQYDEFNVGINTAMRFAESEIAIDCAPTVHPNSQLGCQVHLPILNFLGQDDLCETWIEVQHLGCDFAKASLVTWGEPGFCPPQAAGPLKVECTGLLKPGATWNMLGAQIPNGSKSGILFKWTAKQLSEIGVDLGFDDVVADYMCETLFFGVVGDADDYRRFKKAYNEGLEFGGVPMDLATGGGALAVDVHRTCPGDVTPGVEVTSKYNGIAGTHLGVYDPVYGGYGYYVPLVYADKAGFTSILYVQNGGLECTSVEVWFQEQDNCLRATICDIATLAPGETYQLDANDCVGPDFQGSAWLRTSQPTGIAVDIVGRDVLMTYIGEPAEINYTFDPADAFFTGGNQVGFAPLIYSEYQGWDSGIQVQNLSGVTAAKVKVYFMDRSGDIITTLVDWVCPRGSQTFFLPVIADLPGNWTGSARVESQEWLASSGPRVEPPNIVAIATLLKYDDAARTNAVEAIAYNLLPEHKIYDWQIGYRTGGNLESGVGLVAIPSLLKDIGGTGLTSELAIANVVPKPGFTDFVIYVYDQNGLLDYVCEKLGSKQVEYIDLQTWGYVNPGFKGSAIISAIFWEHDVHDSTGRFVRNLVGLGAVAIERNSTRLGMDVPGDEAAGSRGIPFAQGISEDDEFEFCPMGDLPLCPGVPLVRPDKDTCPAEATFDCINCPLNIPAAGTSGMMDTALADVDISSACTITDVDVLLNLNHTFLGDLVVSVTSPEGTPSTLFTQICGGNNDIMAIVDDDAPTPIGSVCSPLGFVRYTTESGVGLDLFDGESADGVWLLDINDLLGGDSGMLNNWSVTVQTR